MTIVSIPLTPLSGNPEDPAEPGQAERAEPGRVERTERNGKINEVDEETRLLGPDAHHVVCGRPSRALVFAVVPVALAYALLVALVYEFAPRDARAALTAAFAAAAPLGALCVLGFHLSWTVLLRKLRQTGVCLARNTHVHRALACALFFAAALAFVVLFVLYMAVPRLQTDPVIYVICALAALAALALALRVTLAALASP